jgi:hypothetical protein
VIIILVTWNDTNPSIKVIKTCQILMMKTFFGRGSYPIFKN